MNKKDPCWDGYEMIGKKNKNGKQVPNCVPVKKNKLSSFHEWLQIRESIDQIAKDAGLDISKFDKKELRMGFKDENKEHDSGDKANKDIDVANSKTDILKIVLAHLREDPHYYTKISKVIEED